MQQLLKSSKEAENLVVVGWVEEGNPTQTAIALTKYQLNIN
jgi:hypothetical protein